MIKHVLLENFKNIQRFDTDLDEINVLIGANNSGKSSVLQGIHFSIMTEVLRRKIQKTNILESKLLYSPSSDFLHLRHNGIYTVSSGQTSKLTLRDETSIEFSITISKGRNEGNLSVTTEKNSLFRQNVTSFESQYSMYVPGISGISLREKYATPAELRTAVARGDANMFIRNVLYLLKQQDKLQELNIELGSIFPGMYVDVPYDPKEDLYLTVNIYFPTSNGSYHAPLEQCGTGTLQVLQILAYTICYSPKLLLLDEPDEHLHPNNQSALAKVLKKMTKSGIQIILCTHSRHLLADLDDTAKVIWMQEGKIHEYNKAKHRYDVLMDLGALDQFDQVLAGKYKYIFLTEDSDTDMCRLLLEHNGIRDVLVFPYHGCASLDSAILLSDLIHNAAPNCSIILHRDRDFMTDVEVEYYIKRIKKNAAVIPFFTKGSDIESYFVSVEHLSNVFSISKEQASEWIKDIIEQNYSDILIDFSNKRNEQKKNPIYEKKDGPKWICAKDMIKQMGQFSPKIVKGKYLKKKINGSAYERFGITKNLLIDSDALDIPEFQALSRC